MQHLKKEPGDEPGFPVLSLCRVADIRKENPTEDDLKQKSARLFLPVQMDGLRLFKSSPVFSLYPSACPVESLCLIDRFEVGGHGFAFFVADKTQTAAD